MGGRRRRQRLLPADLLLKLTRDVRSRWDSFVMQPIPSKNSGPRWWCVNIMHGARIERLGIVHACDYEAAIYEAMEKFNLEEQQQRRLIVWLEESGQL
jgi:hypothetical protein